MYRNALLGRFSIKFETIIFGFFVKIPRAVLNCINLVPTIYCYHIIVVIYYNIIVFGRVPAARQRS